MEKVKLFRFGIWIFFGAVIFLLVSCVHDSGQTIKKKKSSYGYSSSSSIQDTKEKRTSQETNNFCSESNATDNCSDETGGNSNYLHDALIMVFHKAGESGQQKIYENGSFKILAIPSYLKETTNCRDVELVVSVDGEVIGRANKEYCKQAVH